MVQKKRSRKSQKRQQRDTAETSMFDATQWTPKTALGESVKQGAVTDIKDIVSKGQIILEAEIVDMLLPGLTSDLLMIGQSKGKFGGGQRRAFRQTQKKTKEGNKPSFSTYAVVGNGDGYIGLGYGKAKETVPAREKAVRNAKLNMIQIVRGSGDWESQTRKAHTIPYAVTGKCGSVRVTLVPAPVGTGLIIEKECQKILKLAGISNIRSHARGKTGTKVNMIKACFDALAQLSKVRIRPQDYERLALAYGAISKQEVVEGGQDE